MTTMQPVKFKGAEPQRPPEGESHGHPADFTNSVNADLAELPLPVAMPYELNLGFLRDPRLRVRAPIKIVVEAVEGGFSAYCEDLNEYGFGADSEQAVVDFQRAIAELYFSLKEEQGRLGADLLRTWSMLSEAVTERAAG